MLLSALTMCARKTGNNYPFLDCNRAVLYISNLRSIWALLWERWKWMSEMDDWMRQDKSMNSNLQQSNRRSPSTCIKWHLERKEYLRNYFFLLFLIFLFPNPSSGFYVRTKIVALRWAHRMCRIMLGSPGLSVSDLGTLERTFNDQFEDESSSLRLYCCVLCCNARLPGQVSPLAVCVY